MADWATISGLATGAGTLVLAIATFGSVRSANRTARVAERSLQVGIRPVLVPSRPDVDPVEHFGFGDTALIDLHPGHGLVRASGDVVYLALALRNVGAGLAVIHGWHVRIGGPGPRPGTGPEHADPDEFRRQDRDLYISANDTSFWQGALREANDPDAPAIRDAIGARQSIVVELLYGDFEGGQRMISRFGLAATEDGGDQWLAGVTRHWSVDGADPRQTGS